MNNNISENLRRELEKLLENKFFFKKPSNTKIIVYSLTFISLIILSAMLKVVEIGAFLVVFPLTYVLGARGLKFYLPLVSVGIVILMFFSSPYMLFWFTMHMVLAYIVYQSIVIRNSKIFIVTAVSAFLFLGIAIYTALLVKNGILNITSEQIYQFVSEIQQQSLLTNQTIDKDALMTTIESLKRTFPVALFIVLFLYSLLLVQYTLSMLGREYIIIPTFPKLSRIMLSKRIANIYIVLIIIELIVSLQVGDNSNNFWYILLQNTSAVMGLVFALNGLFTAFFFAELKQSETTIKVLLVIILILFSPILELLGFIDSVFKLRESYITMKKGR